MSGTAPTRHDRSQPDNRTAPRKTSGQIIIMFALFLTTMLGMVGLAMDLGFAFAQRRSMQNAADAGALAGARAVAKWTPANNLAAAGEVEAVVLQNGMADATPTVTLCEYVNYANQSVGPCSAAVPTAATGVRVRVLEQHSTFFIKVVPGAPSEVTTQATATAHVQRFAGFPSDGPFLVCGTDAWDVTGNPTLKKGGINTDIIADYGTSPPTINPDAVGRTFRVHDPNLDLHNGPPEPADCSREFTDEKDKLSNHFKGLAETKNDVNAGKQAGDMFRYDTGVHAGPTRVQVDGIQGCQAGGAQSDCVMLLPIAKAVRDKKNKEVLVVGFAPFLVTRVDANAHNAKLLDDYIVLGRGTNDWCRDCGGTVVIRLTA